MAREPSPAFQFYPQDFLSDHNVIAMNAEAKGVYIVLLCHCWIAGSIPSDQAQIQRIAGWEPHPCRRHLAGQWDRIWQRIGHCFGESPANKNALIHPRIERERQKQARFRALKRNAGLASANRRATERQQKSNRQATESNPPSSSSSSSSSSSTNVHISNKLTPTLGEENKTNGGGPSKRPIYQSDRFVVFEWQLDNLTRSLGEHADAFDLHAWFDTLTQRSREHGLVIPKRCDDWLQAQTIAEAQRRGLPVATGAAVLGKRSTQILNMLAKFKAEGAQRDARKLR